jgi:hypothetical protein
MRRRQTLPNRLYAVFEPKSTGQAAGDFYPPDPYREELDKIMEEVYERNRRQ